MSLGFGLFILVVFIAVVFLLEGGYVLWNDHRGPEVQRLQKRLQVLSAGEHGTELIEVMKSRKLSEAPWADRMLATIPRVAALDRWLQQSGTGLAVGRFMFMSAVCGLTPLLLASLFRLPLLLVFAFSAIGASLPALFVGQARSKRLHKFDEQLPDALDLMARALRAGHAFPAALQMVATEAQDPAATEFQHTHEEVNYGVAVQDAMLNLANRVPSMDLRYFIVAVLLQRETGGNLAEILDNLSMLIRERFKLLARVRVLASEGKLSAYILITLPFATATVIYLVNPKFISTLWTDPTGFKFTAGAVLMMVVGALWMWRIVKIRV
jgi:tight adherence protein B